jgi:hypothetical protein
MENVWEAIQQDGNKNVGMLGCIKYKRQWESLSLLTTITYGSMVSSSTD